MIMGFVQMVLTVYASMLLFSIPLNGNVFILLFTGLIFIIATLGVGILFSTVAKNQLQAVQMSMFFFLPSMMLSGFMFSFQAMPFWARCIGYCLPLTHFNVIIRNIMLKGAGFTDIQFRVYYILIFLFIVLTVGVRRYRQTLD
jgi:ABC-2 type transport system permease protein